MQPIVLTLLRSSGDSFGHVIAISRSGNVATSFAYKQVESAIAKGKRKAKERMPISFTLPNDTTNKIKSQGSMIHETEVCCGPRRRCHGTRRGTAELTHRARGSRQGHDLSVHSVELRAYCWSSCGLVGAWPRFRNRSRRYVMHD